MKIKKTTETKMCPLSDIAMGECFMAYTSDGGEHLYLLLPKMHIRGADSVNRDDTDPDKRLAYDIQDNVMELVSANALVRPVDTTILVGGGELI